MTSTFQLDLDRMKMNQSVKYRGQRSFRSHTYTHDRVIFVFCSDKVVRNTATRKYTGHFVPTDLSWCLRSLLCPAN